MQDGHEHQAVHSPDRKTTNETVRVRWKPTPQQITILEHIFNSGTVNPPKDVTTNIRKQLEQFGPVEDVNIFYWFQNRRSRWSRRQRQMRSDSAAAADSISINHHIDFSPPLFNFQPSPQSSFFPDCNANIRFHASSSSSTNHSYEQNSGGSMFPDTTSHPCMPHYPAGCIRVFINGKATKLPTRPVDMRGMFGQDLVLVHPTGVPVNEFGFDLEHGESYFLVPRPT